MELMASLIKLEPPPASEPLSVPLPGAVVVVLSEPVLGGADGVADGLGLLFF